jgi:hypothetical protein
MRRPAAISSAHVAGRLVRAWGDGATGEGERRAVLWDGRNASGRPAPGGVYFYRIEGPRGAAQGRIVRLDR